MCVALGIDMVSPYTKRAAHTDSSQADCVFPTRTARFGVALTFDGPMNLSLRQYATDFDVIDRE